MARSYKHLFIALLPLVAAIASALPAGAESASSRGWATPTVSPEEVKCELQIVDGLVRECCKATGIFNPGWTNCTNFMRNFDDFCVKKLGPARCKVVTVWCPQGGGHALNMVQLSDGKWYLVEPQSEVYGDYPLPSPEIPDEVLAAVMPGCGCKYAIEDQSYTPNTDPYVCTGEDYKLWGSGSIFEEKNLTPTQSCLKCCASLPTPPNHPNPELFHSRCNDDCELSGLELSREEYCARRYLGDDCEFCCNASFEPSSTCKQKCRSKPSECSPSGGVMWFQKPETGPNSCVQKGLPSNSACVSCCHSESRVCQYRNSMPCTGWIKECVRACNRNSSKSVSSSSSQGSKSSQRSSTTP